jgi:uncharacterized iron-regulated protein
MDNENETIPENEQEQEIVVDEVETTELSDADKLAKAQAEANKWRRIAQKKDKPQITNPDLSDELKLIARGLSDEEIEQAKVVAKGKGVSLTEAIKDPLFTTFQERIKEEKRKEDAKLGATRGSGESSDESLVKPDMTREEHMKVFKKVHGLK